MNFLERLRQRFNEKVEDWFDRAKLGTLINEVLEEKTRVPSERAIVDEIEAALHRKEIQVGVDSSEGMFEEPIVVRSVYFRGFEQRGVVAALSVQKGWTEEAFRAKGPSEDGDLLYLKLKQVCVLMDQLRLGEVHILTASEIHEIGREKAQMRQGGR